MSRLGLRLFIAAALVAGEARAQVSGDFVAAIGWSHDLARLERASAGGPTLRVGFGIRDGEHTFGAGFTLDDEWAALDRSLGAAAWAYYRSPAWHALQLVATARLLHLDRCHILQSACGDHYLPTVSVGPAFDVPFGAWTLVPVLGLDTAWVGVPDREVALGGSLTLLVTTRQEPAGEAPTHFRLRFGPLVGSSVHLARAEEGAVGHAGLELEAGRSGERLFVALRSGLVTPLTSGNGGLNGLALELVGGARLGSWGQAWVETAAAAGVSGALRCGGDTCDVQSEGVLSADFRLNRRFGGFVTYAGARFGGQFAAGLSESVIFGTSLLAGIGFEGDDGS